jgi:hypothetical protein
MQSVQTATHDVGPGGAGHTLHPSDSSKATFQNAQNHDEMIYKDLQVVRCASKGTLFTFGVAAEHLLMKIVGQRKEIEAQNDKMHLHATRDLPIAMKHCQAADRIVNARLGEVKAREGDLSNMEKRWSEALTSLYTLLKRAHDTILDPSTHEAQATQEVPIQSQELSTQYVPNQSVPQLELSTQEVEPTPSLPQPTIPQSQGEFFATRVAAAMNQSGDAIPSAQPESYPQTLEPEIIICSQDLNWSQEGL